MEDFIFWLEMGLSHILDWQGYDHMLFLLALFGIFAIAWFKTEADLAPMMELAKREALAAYASEMRPWPHARSLEALEYLARWRGAQVGVEAAEAFCLLRQLVPHPAGRA